MDDKHLGTRIKLKKRLTELVGHERSSAASSVSQGIDDYRSLFVGLS
jgi:hypothetical protein